MYTFKSFRARSILRSLNFLRIHPYTILDNNMTQVLNFKDPKNTFWLFEEKFVLGEEMENLIYMGEMGMPHFNMDDNIIKES